MADLLYFNSHAHCFTIEHVPENFFDELLGGKQFLRISKIRKSPFLRTVIKVGTSSFIRKIVGWFAPITAHQLQRLHGLIKYAIEPTQENLIDDLASAYNNKYRLVLLTMDMEFMGAGLCQEPFVVQLQKLQAIKRSLRHKDNIYPFVFADPRRGNITSLVQQYLTDTQAPFQGIKLYPAMGYFPFDRRLKSIYQFAVENDVPLLTHCIVGDVHQRDQVYHLQFPTHPITGQSTTPSESAKKPEYFQINFTHPLNIECLLNKNIISTYYGEEVDFSKLKICIGHFGGEEEWEICKKQEAKSTTKYKSAYDYNPLDINQNWLGDSTKRYSWLKIIKELIRKYPNVYADISYTLHSEKIYPVLKSMLKDRTLKHRILYGTDYYVVASEMEEKDIITLMNKHLTSSEIKLISYDNPLRFLSSKLNPVIS